MPKMQRHAQEKPRKMLACVCRNRSRALALQALQLAIGRTLLGIAKPEISR
jgi:hypothetical protein